MEAVIADNSLQKKVRFVVTDNASNKMKALALLSYFMLAMPPASIQMLTHHCGRTWMLMSTNQSLPVCQLVCRALHIRYSWLYVGVVWLQWV